MIAVEHLPDRPSWNCQTCEKPWPCDPARQQLSQEYDKVGLAMYAWDRLSQAAEDIPAMAAPELFERFLAWTRRMHDR